MAAVEDSPTPNLVYTVIKEYTASITRSRMVTAPNKTWYHATSATSGSTHSNSTTKTTNKKITGSPVRRISSIQYRNSVSKTTTTNLRIVVSRTCYVRALPSKW